MTKRIRLSSKESLKQVAYHEAGHAIMELYYGIVPNEIEISETDGQTRGGDFSDI